MDLSTTYLGLSLPNPLVVGSGPATDDLDSVRALEDAGAAALVLRCLFEDDITGDQLHELLHVESHSESFGEASTYSPDPESAPGADEYLEHLQRVKRSVRIPVIAALNGVTPEGWVWYAGLLEQAGADAIELQYFHPGSDMTTSAADVERLFIDVARSVKKSVRIPVAVKLTSHLTAFGHFAKQLDLAGVDGLTLFARPLHADIDVEELEVIRSVLQSDSTELSLRLRGTAALSGRVKACLALAGGVHTGLDVIKATMAGAHVAQVVSGLVLHGPHHLRTIRTEVEAWMQEHDWDSLNRMRGNMGFERVPNPGVYERFNIRVALR